MTASHKHKNVQRRNQKPVSRSDQDNEGSIPQAEPADLVQKAQTDVNSLSPHDVLQLQRTLGNSAAQRLIQRQVEVNEQDAHGKGCGCVQCSRVMLQRDEETAGMQPNGLVGEIMNAMAPQHEVTKAPDISVQRIFGWGKKKTEREKFNAEKFKLRNHIPSTGTGKFDADYNPKTGKLIITSKINFDFQDSSAYADQATDPADTRWTEPGKKAWADDFVNAVMSKWGSISPIKSDKPGFEDVVVKPEINIVFVPKKKDAHYGLTVTKAFVKKTGGMRAGGFSGLTRDGGGSFQEQDTGDKINDPKLKPHLAKTEETTNISPAYKRDRERLVETLGKIGPIMFVQGSEALAPGMDANLTAAAKAIAALREDSALVKLHTINIKVALGSREPGGLVGARLATIRSIFDANGVTQKLAVQQAMGTPLSATFETGAESPEMVKAYVDNWSRITAAHEFGHAIGLLDEYCPAVSPELLQKMVTEGKITNTTLSDYANGKKAQNEKEQGAYASLLTKTGMNTPNWARPTATSDEKGTSLMSGGFEVLQQHYVTIWEALTKMTAKYVPEAHWKF
jgi:hypothetical protein